LIFSEDAFDMRKRLGKAKPSAAKPIAAQPQASRALPLESTRVAVEALD
jgi:hypothetical protein